MNTSAGKMDQGRCSSEVLLPVVERGGPTMLARIGVMRAIICRRTKPGGWTEKEEGEAVSARAVTGRTMVGRRNETKQPCVRSACLAENSIGRWPSCWRQSSPVWW